MRTAAATAAWMRRADEKRAEHLRGRGWVCIAPEDVPAARSMLAETYADAGARQLVATVRREHGLPGSAPDSWVRVTVQPESAGAVVATWTSPGYVPPADHINGLRDLGSMLASQGWHVTSGWVVGNDALGRYAFAPVAQATERDSERDQA